MAVQSGVVKLDISTKFMQDFETGGSPILLDGKTGISSGNSIIYGAQDGSVQIYTLGAKAGPNGQKFLLRAARDPDNEGSWYTVVTPLIEDDNPYVPYLDPEAIVLLPGAPDRIMVFLQNSIQETIIGPDGALGAATLKTKKDLTLLPGGPCRGHSQTLPPGARFVLEHKFDRVSRSSTGFLVRDLTDYSAYDVQPGALSEYPTKLAQLADNGSDRLMLVAEEFLSASQTEVLSSYTFVLNRSNKTFEVKRKDEIRSRATLATLPFALSSWHLHNVTPGQATLVFLDLPQVSTQQGNYDPSGDDAIAWQAPWSSPLPNFPLYPVWTTKWVETKPTVDFICAWNSAASAIECFFNLTATTSTGSMGELWTFSLVPGSTLTEPAPLYEGFPFLFDATGSGDPVRILILQDCYLKTNRLELWARNKDGDFDTMPLVADTDEAPPRELAGYRIGLTLTQDNLPLSDQSLGLTASRVERGLVGGRSVTFPTTKPLAAQTDPNGQVWLTVYQDKNLSFPTLAVHSPLFGATMTIDVDQEIQTYLTNVTDDELRQARDPRTGKSVLKSPDSAGAIGSSLRAALAAAPKPQVHADAALASKVMVTSTCAYSWRRGPLDAAALTRRAAVALETPSWSLEDIDGVPHFRRLTASEASARIAQVKNAHPSIKKASLAGGPHPMNWFDDAIDWVGDVASSAWDGVVKVKDVFVNGLEMTVTLVVDGLTYFYNGVIDTIDRVMDVVTFILNKAGEALGTAVGWLLSQLGFLFDWGALKGKRDALRNQVRNGITAAVQSLPDPATVGATFGATIVAAKGAVVTELNSLRSKPIGTQPLGNTMGSVPSLPSWLMSSGSSIMPQSTWLLDKVQDAISRVLPDIGMPNIPGLDTAFTNLAQALQASTRIGDAALDGVVNLVTAWIGNGELFTSSVLDPVIDLISGLISAVFDLIKDVAAAAAQAMHLLWANPTAIVDWMDTPVSIPFFGGFYKGLTGNTFSLFDASCLAAAVVEAAFGGVSDGVAASMATKETKDNRPPPSVCFMLLGCVTEGFSAFNDAEDPKHTTLSTCMNAAMTAGAMACATSLDNLDADGKAFVHDYYAVTAVGGVAALFAISPPARQFVKANYSNLLLVGLLIYRLAVFSERLNDRELANAILGLVKTLGSGGVRIVQSRKVQISPTAAAVYAAIQMALSGARTGLYAAQIAASRS